MEHRKRNIQVKFRVDEQERALLEQRMAQLGAVNMGAYLRKMALDGYILKLDLPELREMVSLLRYSSNNLNQIAKRANATGRVYDADLQDIRQRQEELWAAASKILTTLAKIEP